MAAQISSMSSFDLEGEDFTEYSERFEQYLIANKITDDNLKRAVFLSTLGAPGYKLLRSLVVEEVKTKTFEQLVKVLKEHLQPAPNVIAQRFRFYKRDRKTGESVNDYIAELRRLSEHCEFGEKLDEYLRDRFVCGLNSAGIQQKLLSTKKLDLNGALDISRSYEAAAKDAKAILGTATGSATGSVVDHGGIYKLGQNQSFGSSLEGTRVVLVSSKEGGNVFAVDPRGN